jgi:hypothetical protein
MFLNLSFFFIPFFLYLGIVLQAAGFYTLCVFMPAFYFLKTHQKIPQFIFKIGVCFILLHLVFPLTNFMNLIFQNQQFPLFPYRSVLTWPGILKSLFPSAFLIGGLLLLIFVKLSERRALKSNASLAQIHPLQFFLAGLLPASCLFCAMLWYQFCTGVDFQNFNQKIDIIVNSSYYRVSGFYGNPLTVSGVSLAVAIFAWTLLWQFLTHKNATGFRYFPFHENKILCAGSLLTIVLCNMAALIFSGGRTALVTAVFLFLVILVLFYAKKKSFFTILIVLCLLLSSFFLMKKYGALSRLENTIRTSVHSHSLNTGENRIYFWEVHWRMFLDKPLIGQGSYWIHHGLRENYYDKMGFTHLSEKFNAHNNYLEILASGGLFAALWILGVLGVCIKIFLRELKNQKSNFFYLPLAFFMMFVANLMHAFTQNVYFDSSVVYIYLGFLFVVLWQLACKQENAVPF